MKTIKNTLKLTLLLLLFVSCTEEEPTPEQEQVVSDATVSPSIGGDNEPNQLYFDFSSNTQTEVRRDSWDLRFYNGNSFRVSLNTSIYMATVALDGTDLNAITESDVSNLFDTVSVATFDPNNVNYVDDFDGDITKTAIAAISDTAEDNKVYLLNLGYEVSTESSDPGSVSIKGAHRGWKKIRILKQGAKYVLRYANLNDTSYQEVEISKNSEFNFSFFSFSTNAMVDVEPNKEKWDICFSVFTNEFPGYGTYGYSDFILSNNLQNVKAYQVLTTDFTFADFTLADVVDSQYISTQRAIGSSWRVGGGPGSSPPVKTDRFYILKDAGNHVFKVRFTALTNDDGVRGNPTFEYSLLE